MQRTIYGALALTALGAVALPAQELAKRVTASDGPVQVIYPTRPTICGDGQSYIRFGRSRTYVGESMFSGESWTSRPCVQGPGRALVSVINGEVTKLSSFVGPVPRSASETRTINA